MNAHADSREPQEGAVLYAESNGLFKTIQPEIRDEFARELKKRFGLRYRSVQR